MVRRVLEARGRSKRAFSFSLLLSSLIHKSMSLKYEPASEAGSLLEMFHDPRRAGSLIVPPYPTPSALQPQTHTHSNKGKHKKIQMSSKHKQIQMNKHGCRCSTWTTPRSTSLFRSPSPPSARYAHPVCTYIYTYIYIYLHPKPYTLHPPPFTLHPEPYTLHATRATWRCCCTSSPSSLLLSSLALSDTKVYEP